jgi:dTDP-4-amino-4,6-dideoxygalactose transaminase
VRSVGYSVMGHSSPSGSSSALALLGGSPTSTTKWPRWPQVRPTTIERVEQVLSSGRWTVSGPWMGNPPLDAVFAERFADFTGTRWCIPVDHGSNALLAALTALDVGPGDEVIVPGLTWVACASAVVRAGALAILVDIDPQTLCVDHRAVEAAITPRTMAILAVHLYSAMADMDELRRVAGRHGLALIEDASQAHGALWGRSASGSLGDIGVFSMHQSKLLTSGEGGAAVTSDAALHTKLEQLRGDGRRYRPGRERRTLGLPDLEEVGEVQGWNMHLSEVQLALLLDGLEQLPGQNGRRTQAARFLDRELASMDGIELVRPYVQNTTRAFYKYVVFVEPGSFADVPVDVVCEAVSAELGTWVHPAIRPLDVHSLYQPLRHPSSRLPGWAERLDSHRFSLREAHRMTGRTLLIPHSLLLGTDQQMQSIVDAVDKVRRNAHLLKDHHL